MKAYESYNSPDFSVEDIRKSLKISDFSNIILLDTVNSTNLFAKELAAKTAPHGTVVIANHQTKGRGRLGRDFFSPGGTGIYMSILFRPDHIETDLTFITIAAGVAVCQAIESLCDKSPKIKSFMLYANKYDL